MKIKNIFGLAVVALAMTACGGKKEEEKAPLPDYNIVTLKAESRDVEYCYPATLTGFNEVNLFPQVEGRIISRNYKEGDFVQKGQALIQIDPTQYKQSAQAAKANVKAAEAALATAKLQFESQNKLFEKKIVSEYVMKTARNNYQTAEAQLVEAKAQLSNVLTNLSHCTVVAPMSGVITRKHDDIGLLVSASMQEPILTITDQRIVKAQFSLTETQFSELFKQLDLVATKDGYRPRKPLGGSIHLRLKDGTLYDKEGKFYNVSGTVDANTGTVTGVVTFDNPDFYLHAGNSATIIFPDSMDNVIAIPQTACKKLQDKYLVFKVDKEGKTVGVVVDVIPTNDGKEYIVTDDKLKAGDEIVADGVARIEEGQKVK